MKKKPRVLAPDLSEQVEYELYSAVRKILASMWATVYVAANIAMVDAYDQLAVYAPCLFCIPKSSHAV